jgi:TRAP-type C4-dicarboxylate transport system permease small subunit
MLGIPDPGIWLAYVLALLCVAFSIWFGINYWNEEEKEEKTIKK